jgi:RNA-binding protein
MKRLGEVVRVAQGIAIARVGDDDPPAIGAPVVDEDLADVGRVVDVFGPVGNPYVAVDCEVADPTGFLGVKLYTR